MIKLIYAMDFHISDKIKNGVLFLIRIMLGLNFLQPGLSKLKDTAATAEFFSSIGIPLPALNVYLAGGTELVGAILLILGLGTKVTSIPLIFVMGVAVVTLHLENGWNAGDNGIEIPVYYALFLLALISYGAGKWSLDYLILRKLEKGVNNEK